VSVASARFRRSIRDAQGRSIRRVTPRPINEWACRARDGRDMRDTIRTGADAIVVGTRAMTVPPRARGPVPNPVAHATWGD
jgi:hypothetical protein